MSSSGEVIKSVQCPLTGIQCTRPECIKARIESILEFPDLPPLSQPCENSVLAYALIIKNHSEITLHQAASQLGLEFGIDEKIAKQLLSNKIFTLSQFALQRNRSSGFRKPRSDN